MFDKDLILLPIRIQECWFKFKVRMIVALLDVKPARILWLNSWKYRTYILSCKTTDHCAVWVVYQMTRFYDRMTTFISKGLDYCNYLP